MNILLTFYGALLVICGITFFKYAWRRKKHNNSKFTIKSSFFSILGMLEAFFNSARIKTLPTTIYMLQLIMGCHHLFKRENFFYGWLSFTPGLILFKAKAVEELISGTKHMEKGWVYDWFHPWLGTGLLTSSGSKWKTRRKLLTPAFHFDILKDFLPIFNEQAHLLVQLLETETKKPWINIIKPITLCSLDIVCESTMGVSVGAQKNSESEYVKVLSRTAKTITKRLLYPPYLLSWYFNLSPTGFQFRKDVKLLQNFTQKVIADKKEKILSGSEDNLKKKRKAFLDLLLEQHMQNQCLTEEDIREEVDTFTFRGHDTTSMGMSWALYLIGLYKDVQEKVHEELDRIFGEDYERDVTMDDIKDMEYLDRVLKESQRIYPSVPFIARKLDDDAILCGTKFPNYFTVGICIYALHRDETVFPNPEKFDPDRFLPENAANRSPFAYIPFSAGPRNCIGQRFAVMEEKVVMANILRNFAVQSLDPRDKVLPVPEVVLRPASDFLRIKLKSRRPVLPS